MAGNHLFCLFYLHQILKSCCASSWSSCGFSFYHILFLYSLVGLSCSFKLILAGVCVFSQDTSPNWPLNRNHLHVYHGAFVSKPCILMVKVMYYWENLCKYFRSPRFSHVNHFHCLMKGWSTLFQFTLFSSAAIQSAPVFLISHLSALFTECHALNVVFSSLCSPLPFHHSLPHPPHAPLLPFVMSSYLRLPLSMILHYHSIFGMSKLYV